MKSLTINGLKRESVGKKHTKALRNAESVPCVLYGKNPPLHFSAKELDFRKLVYTSKAYTVKLNVNNDSFDAIIQDIQFHPVSGKILHIDFYELSENKEISISIPVEITGSAPGVLISGGVLIINKRKLKVKALPKNLPDSISVDISNLELGQKIYTVDLKHDDYSFLHSENTVICQVKTSRASLMPEIEEPETDSAETDESKEGAKDPKAEENKETPKENENKDSDQK